MTKKHFVALAQAFAAERPGKYLDPEAFMQWETDRNAVAGVCAQSNPNFDRDRFIAATEA